MAINAAQAEKPDTNQRNLRQWFTHPWACQRLVETYFPDLSAADTVLEPTCGPFGFLGAIPPEVDAIGVELDPMLAERARRNTGREIICGDIRLVTLPRRPTAIIGNPPFLSEVVDAIVGRAGEWLEEGGTLGLMLPAYVMSDTQRVLTMHQRWSMKVELIPRALFKGLAYPLVWAMWQKLPDRKLIGFALFHELYDVRSMDKADREALERPGRTWRDVFEQALDRLGGTASLEAIYREVAPRRISGNPWWKDSIRRIAQDYVRIDRGVYTLQRAA